MFDQTIAASLHVLIGPRFSRNVSSLWWLSKHVEHGTPTSCCQSLAYGTPSFGEGHGLMYFAFHLIFRIWISMDILWIMDVLPLLIKVDSSLYSYLLWSYPSRAQWLECPGASVQLPMADDSMNVLWILSWMVLRSKWVCKFPCWDPQHPKQPNHHSWHMAVVISSLRHCQNPNPYAVEILSSRCAHEIQCDLSWHPCIKNSLFIIYFWKLFAYCVLYTYIVYI